ncbi:MAG: TRAP transporter small permease subunit [Sagittula sp.]|jgi:TRAP-type mannitol/chloroaromatic compound transport system permease small subunit|uniref:TRAP transporter small permease subunit n=1 Tax=unclassified Sagittula TaxID=2624628 RepID=UPI000C2D1C37|nr:MULTISPECIES: TRAP transporter small permease subunit [unclassified Sagittula]AUC55409.1 C4-dicarboxylate ABC transporter permease [Sagittula sp. P11]WHZ37432.1 C4-dicarboxylate ABC transporter permease [Sagittula sp. MA-2]
MDETAAGGGILSGIGWVLQNIAMSFYNLGYAITHPASWLDWSDQTAIMRFIYYGASVELWFIVVTFFLVLFAIGLWKRSFLWGVVIGLEFFGNWVGRFFAWAGLLMVLQQVIIVFIQRIFARPDIVVGFGIPIGFDISWWAEELKLYNAMVVALCLAYTFIQGGHVRVDLVYSAVSFRTKRIIDMAGSLFFMIPMATLIWLYTWYFQWRSLIVPPVNPTDPLDRLEMKARALRWNVETIGFSPNGFTAYFLFKILMVIMVGMIFIQAWTFFFRSYLEFVEGEESEGKYLDRDKVETGEEAYDHAEF